MSPAITLDGVRPGAANPEGLQLRRGPSQLEVLVSLVIVYFLVFSCPRVDCFSCMRHFYCRTTKTVRFLGPWTPSTRASSMSEVAEGPETIVRGRPKSKEVIAPTMSWTI